MNILKGWFSSGAASTAEALAVIPSGQLYLVRPNSPKGRSELIFTDCQATIRKSSQEHYYQLAIQRVVEEGEEALAAEEGEEDELDGLAEDKNEKTFVLHEELRFRLSRRDGQSIFAWRDISGDTGDLYEFVCDKTVQGITARKFEDTAHRCQYERKYKRNGQTASDKDLQQFSFDDEPVPKAAPIMSAGKAETAVIRQPEVKKEVTAAPEEISGEVLADEMAELHVFDSETASFVLQEDEVNMTMTDVGKWRYVMQVKSKSRFWFKQDVDADMNGIFNYEYLSFIFNHVDETGLPYSWLLRTKDQPTLQRIQEGFMQCTWEQTYQTKYAKAQQKDIDFLTEAMQDVVMEDDPKEEEEEESEPEPVTAESEEDYDSDESQENKASQKSAEQNSQLAVGNSNDRSFVVRGSQIGVFKHGNDDKIRFDVNISKVQTPKGKLFSPKKVMLHGKDRNMILQNADDPNSVYQMDLEYGKIVDEWKVHDDIPISHFAPESKFAQTTDEQTFLGLSDNALFRVDPRLAGNKLVDSQLKQYVTKNKFSSLATTEKGYIAVASAKGEIRLFDRVGINAKTALPAIGEPIIGLDTTADGQYVLATCKNYLLLIDTQQKDGKNKGKLGFERSFAADAKPAPKRLTLSPEHVAQVMHETKTGISFTHAHFNTGREAAENSIVTSTGPYVITWNLAKVLANRKGAYQIKRYTEDVKADNFRFGSDKNVIVALPNEVDMVAKKALLKPTRESIGLIPTTPQRKGTRKSGLRKSEVVNSPY